eukprot:12711821-Ditylum_brightwellii.AAC.1
MEKSAVAAAAVNTLQHAFRKRQSQTNIDEAPPSPGHIEARSSDIGHRQSHHAPVSNRFAGLVDMRNSDKSLGSKGSGKGPDRAPVSMPASVIEPSNQDRFDGLAVKALSRGNLGSTTPGEPDEPNPSK